MHFCQQLNQYQLPQPLPLPLITQHQLPQPLPLTTYQHPQPLPLVTSHPQPQPLPLVTSHPQPQPLPLPLPIPSPQAQPLPLPSGCLPLDELIERDFEGIVDVSQSFKNDYPTLDTDTVTKNRYLDVLPQTSTIVQLRAVAPSGAGTYINANRIQIHDQAYIVTQSPVYTSIGDMWQMVWENDCPVIVSLNKLVECMVVKGARYWPDGKESFGPFSLTLLREQWEEGGLIMVRAIQVDYKNQSRLIHQLHYEGWPDKGVPSSPEGMNNILKLMNKIIKESPLKGPPVVHCSAGIGRSCTFVAISSLFAYLIKNNIPLQSSLPSLQVQDQNEYNERENQNLQPVGLAERRSADGSRKYLSGLVHKQEIYELVKDVVLKIRRQRHHCAVQTVQQYKFIFAALANL